MDAADRAAAPNEALHFITVPKGVNPGDMLRVTAPDGQKMLITVPPSAVAGAQLEFTLPARKSDAAPVRRTTSSSGEAAVAIQSLARGRSARIELKKAAAHADGVGGRQQQAPPTAIPTAEQPRGEDEARRLAWVEHYAAVGEYDLARELCLNQEEASAIHSKNKPSAAASRTTASEAICGRLRACCVGL